MAKLKQKPILEEDRFNAAAKRTARIANDDIAGIDKKLLQRVAKKYSSRSAMPKKVETAFDKMMETIKDQEVRTSVYNELNRMNKTWNKQQRRKVPGGGDVV